MPVNRFLIRDERFAHAELINHLYETLVVGLHTCALQRKRFNGIQNGLSSVPFELNDFNKEMEMFADIVGGFWKTTKLTWLVLTFEFTAEKTGISPTQVLHFAVWTVKLAGPDKIVDSYELQSNVTR